ncbi:MAG TPA: glutamine amidotransferase [Verrucomicrobiota bacterium]|nr:glutamine amidotransferase [Verrucomicrobiota bacterium]
MTSFAAIVFSSDNWLPAAAAALLLLSVAVIWSGHRNAVEARVRLGCALLKITGIVLVLLCLLEPLWVGQRARPGANAFALIADNSRGLQIKDAGETRTRGERLRHQLLNNEKGWQSLLEETFQVRRYLFDSRLQSTRDFSELNFEGRASAIGNALLTAAAHWRGQPVAGVLLFTDGNATDIAGELPPLEDCPPVYPVVQGRDSDIPDLSLAKVGVSQTAFEDAPVTIQARVAATGMSDDVQVRLTEVAVGTTTIGTNGSGTYRITSASNVVAELTQRRVQGGEHDFRLQVRPTGPGLHFYELETRAREEADRPDSDSREATLANNRRMIVVDRGQEPLRVLYVGGRPNWEYKFLNRAIQEDPQVQMVSLIRVATRERKFEFRGRAGESSNPLYRGFALTNEETARYDQPVIIRLNTKDEFELHGGFPKTAEELFGYKAVILDDVEAEFFTHDQLALLHRFVSERGGGFLMLGGAESFREGGYANTPVATLLPVYLDRAPQARLPSEFRLTLTREGWLQPWTRLRSTEQEEKDRLAAMPTFDVLNVVREIKPGASILATVSDGAGQTYPALAVQRFGLGRTAALMIGNLWQWGMKDEVMQQDLARSWRQLVRWLVADVPQHIEAAVSPAPSGDPGEVRLTVKARDEEFKPLDNAIVQLVVRGIGNPLRDPGQTNGTTEVRLTAEPSGTQPGVYEATFIARQAGAYSVQANVTRSDGVHAGQAVAGWASDPAADEFRSLKPNRALLEEIARKTGGELVEMDDLEAFVRGLPKRQAPITETYSTPLWHQPWVLLVILGCFVAEWGIRRWKGLP